MDINFKSVYVIGLGLNLH